MLCIDVASSDQRYKGEVSSAGAVAWPSGLHPLTAEVASSEVAKNSARALAGATAQPVQSIFLYLEGLTSLALSNTVPL